MDSKLFIGGLPRNIDDQILKEHFEIFGEVKDYEVIRDKQSGTSKGFGFVTFFHSSPAHLALQHAPHVILGKTVDVKQAIPKTERLQYNIPGDTMQDNRVSSGNVQINPKKIFVGGLHSSVTNEDLVAYFQMFGSIQDTVVLHDKETGRPRGFGFVSFTSEDTATRALATRFHQIKDKQVEVKKAVVKDYRKASENNFIGYNDNCSWNNTSYLYAPYSFGYPSPQQPYNIAGYYQQQNANYSPYVNYSMPYFAHFSHQGSTWGATHAICQMED